MSSDLTDTLEGSSGLKVRDSIDANFNVGQAVNSSDNKVKKQAGKKYFDITLKEFFQDWGWVLTFGLYRGGATKLEGIEGQMHSKPHGQMQPIPAYRRKTGDAGTNGTRIQIDLPHPNQVYIEVDNALRTAGYGSIRFGNTITMEKKTVATVDPSAGIIATADEKFYRAINHVLDRLGYKVKIDFISKN